MINGKLERTISFKSLKKSNDENFGARSHFIRPKTGVLGVVSWWLQLVKWNKKKSFRSENNSQIIYFVIDKHAPSPILEDNIHLQEGKSFVKKIREGHIDDLH